MSGFGLNPNTNIFKDAVSDLTPKPATDSDLRPNPKDSVKSRECKRVDESRRVWYSSTSGLVG